ncbi:MAG: MFS transporter [Anaerolineae bacterium]
MTVLRAIRSAPVFTSLHNRDFRWLWWGRLASSATFQMNTVVQGWLVYELTGSALALGLVGAGWSLSTLFLSLYGGVICDRAPKRTILLWSRGGMLLNSLTLGLLVSLKLIQVWHLAAASIFTGVLFAFMMPAQQAIITELVDRDTLLNANSLNSIGMGLMGIFAASLAGLMITIFGPQGVYYFMAALYVMAVYTITKLPELASRGGDARGSIWVDLTDGLRYLGTNKTILVLLLLGLFRTLLATPYRTMMPMFSTEVMGFDAAGLGMLMAAPGVGSLISSVWVASLRNFRGKGKLYLAAGISMGIALILFVRFPYLAVVMVFLSVVGASDNICMVSNQTLVQLHSEERYLGRVMSVSMMLMGLTHLGTVPAGFLADRLGVITVITIQGIGLIATFGYMLLRSRVRRLE